MVITCPLPLRSTFEGPIGATRWNTSVALLIDALKAEMGLTWCYCRSHPAGEDGKVFAPHANLLWQSSIQAGKLDTDRIRTLWAQALGYTGPVVVDCGYLTLDDFVGRSQLRHWCNYVERCFPGWSWLGQWARYYGQYPPAPSTALEKADHDYCPECGLAYQLSSPGEKDSISIAGFETLLDSGQPVHPKNARAWCVIERIPPRAPEPKAQVLEQSVLFREGDHQTWHTEGPRE